MKLCPRCALKLRDEDTTCPDDGASPIIAPGDTDARLGMMAGGFRILDVIGSGGMSSVYRAYQASMDRCVAVKVMSRPADRELVQRFLREAQQTAKLRCPNTISVYDHGVLENGDRYLAMELLSGRSLAKLIEAEGAVEPERIARVLMQVCASLEEAHAQGLVHRDIKPSNIMIEPAPVEGGDPLVKVVDFGIVKVLDERGSQLTETGWIFGTAAYMAPEMWGDKHGTVGPATDVYALGVVLFEALSGGKIPFEARGTPQLGYAHVYEPPLAITAVREDLIAHPHCARIERILEKCLAKKPEDRWASIAELRRELAALLLQREEPEASRAAEPAPALQDVERTLKRRALKPPPAKKAGSLKWMAPIAAVAIAIIAAIALAPSPQTQTPIAPAVPATHTPTTSAAITPPSPPPAPAKKPPLIRRTRTVGVTPTDADRALTHLEPALTACYDQLATREPLTVHLIIDAAGHPTTIRSTPEHAAFTTCLRPRATAITIALIDGVAFGTISATIGPR